MDRLSSNITDSLSAIPGIDADQIRKAQRIGEVRALWESLVEDIFLRHTNGVYIFDEDGKRQMHVYMDESIYAAELNARRELIKLECREKFGEVIDEFHIHISRGKRKTEHPFINDDAVSIDGKPPVPLTEKKKKK